MRPGPLPGSGPVIDPRMPLFVLAGCAVGSLLLKLAALWVNRWLTS